jgi:hypothetical protein
MMEITVEQIGMIDHGIDGADLYMLLVRKDDDLTPQQAQDWLLPRVYQRCRGPGGVFVDTVLAVQAQYSKNQVICTVQHRRDI